MLQNVRKFFGPIQSKVDQCDIAQRQDGLEFISKLTSLKSPDEAMKLQADYAKVSRPDINQAIIAQGAALAFPHYSRYDPFEQVVPLRWRAIKMRLAIA